MTGVLDGIRVLDFGRYIAGPFCGMLLGDMGAEVIRIDKLSGSEDRYLVPVAESGEGPRFLAMNRNKMSLTLNPMKPEGREVVRKLVETADVVIANLPQPTLEAMGIDYDSLKAIKPDIISRLLLHMETADLTASVLVLTVWRRHWQGPLIWAAIRETR